MKRFSIKSPFLLILSAALSLVLTSPAKALTHAFIWTSDTGMTDLGSLSDGGDSVALGINDRGQVVGESYVAGTAHAFIWTEATGMVDMGLLEGNLTSAVAINSRGGVAGGSFDGSRSSTFLWTSSLGFVALLQSGLSDVAALAINDSNKVVGLRSGAGKDNAFIWDPKKGIVRSLGFLSGGDSSQARDINNFDHVTGWAGLPNGAQHVFLWTRPGGMSDLGTPAGTFRAYAEAINDQDEIVGEADLGSFEKLFYWNSTTGYRILQTLGAVAGYALDIKNTGEIVGACAIPNSSSFHAVLWPDSLSAPQDLGTLPGGTFAVAFGINNLGQVVGQSDLAPDTDRR